MPVYNGGRHLREAIDSVLAQSFRDFELLIIDDGSTDDSFAIAAAFDDPRIRIVKNERNLGLAVTRNRAVSLARGRYLALLDADDIALPTRLEQQFRCLEANAHAGLVASGVELMRDDGRVYKTHQHALSPKEIPSHLLFTNCLAQSSVMLRREAIPAEGYREAYPPAEDYDLWIRMVARWDAHILPEPLVRYRVHAESTSQRATERLQASEQRIASDQLHALGLEFTPDELALHLRLSALPKPAAWPTVAAVQAADVWLCRLRDANRARQKYPVAIFERELTERWRTVCRGAASLGPDAWEAFWSSMLLSLPAEASRALSDADAERHAATRLGEWQYQRTPEFVAAAEAWLLEIDRRNTESNAYSPSVLHRVLGERWVEVCTAASSLGAWTYRRFGASPLSRYTQHTWMRRIEMPLRCLIAPMKQWRARAREA